MAAAADDDNDNADDDGGNRCQAEVKVKLVNIQPSDSRRELDTAERHSATLYVSRLSQFIATLVDNVTVSSLDADRSLQQFASNFCTGDHVIMSYSGVLAALRGESGCDSKLSKEEKWTEYGSDNVVHIINKIALHRAWLVLGRSVVFGRVNQQDTLTHLRYGITQCYPPPGRNDISTLTAAT